ncbi:MAG: AraC family transcriptional regulator [Syntrophomonadaceae bacterium]|jgi:AraC family transcriptional regulator
MGKFDNFIDKINPEIHSRTGSYISTNLAIFEPESYLIDQEMCFNDYHFILFYSTPPPARVDKKPYQFKKGNLVSFIPGSSLTVLPADSNEYPVNYLDITINKDFFQNIASELNRTNEIKFKRIETAFSHHLIESIINFKNEIYCYGDSIPLMVDSISTQIVVQLLRDINGSHDKFNEKVLRDQQSVNRAIDYMQSYFSAPISIEDICQTVNLSPHYFIRLFKQQTDQTPYQYLMAIRIERAKSMLVNSNYTMGEVANICGFINPGHFATLFKRYEGISPSDYRKQKMGL